MQWVSQRIVETFESSVTQVEVNEFLASPSIRKLFDELLSGKDACKVFVHFQNGATVATVENGAAPATNVDAAAASNNNSKLCVSLGNSIPIRAKCCFFLRTTADGKPVGVQKASDNAICFGELAPNILRDLETTISSLFSPLLKAKDEWGKADADLKNEFMTESEKFANDLKEALNSMDSGLELRRPDRSILAETVNNAGHGVNGARMLHSPKLITHYEEVLKEWCNVISTYLETNTTNDGKGNDDQTIDDDLKVNEYKDVFAVLSQTTKRISDDTKQRIQTLLRRWKQIDIGITEAANEAKDNVMYLFTLEKFIIPLYNGTPSSIIDTLPALMNSIKMIHSIARYYNTTERMANLFTKITNQMITICEHCVTGDDTYEVMWDKDPEELAQHLDSCLKLNEACQQQYRVTKDKLFATPKGKQFEFNKMEIFGKFDLFCRRHEVD
ncbi:hypothetical protein PF004_g19688 [Phytophthora fragariae]|uniref:Dynein heavy chain tail domain-containing protein n=1 Tax=Phytophthora fragariae TaxID=53985 RepID=A0A6G0N914_9STRA|nr:hypothetical protein PF004_g19688 [Phytophthora fragariae]